MAADSLATQRATGDRDDVIKWKLFLVTGPLWGEFTGDRWFPLTKASDAELWCFLWSAPQQTVEQTIEMPVIWDAIAVIMASLQWWFIIKMPFYRYRKSYCGDKAILTTVSFPQWDFLYWCQMAPLYWIRAQEVNSHNIYLVLHAYSGFGISMVNVCSFLYILS